MNGFEKHPLQKIEQQTNKAAHKAEKWVRRHMVLTIIMLILGVFTLKGVVGAIKSGTPFSVTQIVVSAVSKEVETDEYGHTNILLLGSGGEGHDGANLMDTMIVTSLNKKKGLVPMLSIPRDLWVENEYLGYGTRINSIYELILDETEDPEFAMEQFVGEIESILDIEIHYYAKIDFTGFEDIVDAVGGVEITVDEAIYDPLYPDRHDLTQFDPFYLEAGTHTLDGETALKYARSRHSSSDFDRSSRQRELIGAIQDKAMSLGFLLSPNKIKNTFYAVSEHLDTNLTISEIVNLGGMAQKINSDAVISIGLHDAANLPGGFLLTPDRELYAGAFVLVPYVSDFSEIQTFTQLYFYHPEAYASDFTIQVLNGTGYPGLAGLTKMYLTRFGLNVNDYGNADTKTVETTSFYPYGEVRNQKHMEETFNALRFLTLGEGNFDTPAVYGEDWPSSSEIIIELGEDFYDFYQNHREHFYLGFY